MTTQQTQLYGAWITPSGDFIPVGTQLHDEVGYKLLRESLNITDERIVKFARDSWMEGSHPSVYRLMYRLGYIRLIFTQPNKYSLEMWQFSKRSKGQESYIENADSIYPVKIYRHESMPEEWGIV